MAENIARATGEQAKGAALIKQTAEEMRKLSREVSKATSEQATSSGQIAEATELVSEKSRQISRALSEHRKGSGNILSTIEAVKEIPLENRKLAFRVSAELVNLQKDVELLGAEMEQFHFSGKQSHSLRLGVVPLQAPSVMFRKFAPLSQYLSGKLGKKVDLRVAIDMDSAVRDIGENITQLCAMGPANYVEANRKYGVKVIAKALRKGKPFHRTAIVVKAGSSLQSVSDLQGKSIAFTSLNSATGHIIPLAMLREAGVTAGDLKDQQYLGEHARVAEGVLDGAFDAGAMTEETADKYRERGLRILQLSAGIPEFNICANPSVDEATIKIIRDAVVSLDISRENDLTVLKSMGKDCTGFVAATEEDYDEFRTMLKGGQLDSPPPHHP
jgi:phosphonate transport system substrate-binding protein